MTLKCNWSSSSFFLWDPAKLNFFRFLQFLENDKSFLVFNTNDSKLNNIIYQGWPDFFARGTKFENYFSIGAAVFKITFNFYEAKKIDLFNSYWEEVCVHFLYKIVLMHLNCLLFKVIKKDPRATKISWRAALWPCLSIYTVDLMPLLNSNWLIKKYSRLAKITIFLIECRTAVFFHYRVHQLFRVISFQNGHFVFIFFMIKKSFTNVTLILHLIFEIVSFLTCVLFVFKIPFGLL